MNLYQSPVIFNEEAHTYELNGKYLKGITRIIKEKVCPDEYADIPQRILEQAAIKGHAVHSSIEMYAKYGIETQSPEFAGFLEESAKSDVLSHIITSEYLVSDEKQYASSIDLLTAADEPNSVYIIDIKRTANPNIPYVTWQTSCYKKFFEENNPGIKVKGIFLLWLRDENHRLQELTPHTAEECNRLLYSDETFYEESKESVTELVAEGNDDLLSLEKKIKEYYDMFTSARGKYEECVEKMQAILQESGRKRFRGDLITASIKSESVRESFNSKKFKEEHPDIYANYITQSTVKSGMTVKIKNN